MALPTYWFNGSIENFDEPPGILPVRVATHRRLVHGNFGTTCFDQSFQFCPDNRKKRLAKGVAIWILGIRNQPAAQRVRAWHTSFERGSRRSNAFQPLEIFDGSQSSRRAQFSRDTVLAPLVM